MSRRSVVISSEHGRSEVEYGRLPVQDLARRISEYERKYGSPLDSYAPRVSCDSAGVYELSDLMDWESLVEELAARRGSRDRVDAVR
jgi:hypothetical protein